MTSDESALDRDLSEPTPELIASVGRRPGDIAVLGAGGKMGPTLVQLLVRAIAAAGRSRRVIAVARFSSARARDAIEAAGAIAVAADLLDPAAVAGLPEARDVIFMAGQKFGTTGQAGRTWAINVVVPGLVAHRYRDATIAAFSTGNVYPLWPLDSAGPTEADPTGPVGEYAQSALARERIFEHAAAHYGTRVAILRLNYAVEPRYGVVRDLADRIRRGDPIDLTMGAVNLIWQRDANAIAIRALERAAAPPFVVNLTGRPAIPVRELAGRIGRRLGIAPTFTGAEAPTALLSNAAAMEAAFGKPPVELDEMIDRVCRWVEAGGSALGKPTRFEEREGRF